MSNVDTDAVPDCLCSDLECYGANCSGCNAMVGG